MQQKTKERTSNNTSWQPERKEEKKNYRLRKIQEAEAELEIEEYINEDSEDGSEPYRLDGLRPERL